MRRFSALLPLLVVWGCSPQKDESVAKVTPPPTPTPEATSSAPEVNSAPTPAPTKPEANPEAKKDAKPGEPAKFTPPPEKPWPPPIPEPGTAGFKPVTNDAVTTLAAVDAQMKRMRDVELTQVVQAAYPAGRGTAEQVSRVKDPNNLLLRYANFEPYGSHYNLVGYTEVRKGGKSQTLVNEKFTPGHRAPSGNILESWPKNFSQHLVNNFADSKSNTLSDLAKAAAKAGWKTSVEKKKFDSGEFQRVVLTSSKAPKRTYTILIEPNNKLPVELQMDVDDTKKTRVTALLRWRQSDKPLTPEDLDPKVKTAPHTSGEMGKKPGA